MIMFDSITRAFPGDAAGSKRQATILSAALAIMLGVFVLYGVAMAQSATLHNAAHDTRHGMSFPCH
jgi:cobalt transporter subunit CbtB